VITLVLVSVSVVLLMCLLSLHSVVNKTVFSWNSSIIPIKQLSGHCILVLFYKFFYFGLFVLQRLPIICATKSMIYNMWHTCKVG
jgi:hypothetical protein